MNVTTKIVVSTADQSVISEETNEDVAIGAPSGGAQASTALVQEEGVTQGQTVTPNEIGTSEFGQKFWMALKTTADRAAVLSCPTSQSITSMIQVDLKKKLHFSGGKAKKKVDAELLEKVLRSKEAQGFGKLLFSLTHPDAVYDTDRTVLGWLQSSKLSNAQFGRYLSVLGAVRSPEAERLLMRHLSNSEFILDDKMTPALQSGMMSLLVRPKREESTCRTLLHLSKLSSAPIAIQHQARLVLGALLHPYRKHKTKPAHIEESLKALLGHLDDADAKADGLGVTNAIAALGNSRWAAAEEHISPYIASKDRYVSHGAIDALSNLRSINNQTEQRLAQLIHDPEWRDRQTDHMAKTAIQLLQKGPSNNNDRSVEDIENDLKVKNRAKNTYSYDEAKDIKDMNQGLAGSTQSFGITLFNRYDELGKSDVHTAGFTTNVGITMVPGNNRLTTASATGTLSVKLYGMGFNPVEAGFVSSTPTYDASKPAGAWSRAFVVKVLGFQVYSTAGPPKTAEAAFKAAFGLLGSALSTAKAATQQMICSGQFKWDTAYPQISGTQGGFSLQWTNTQSYFQYWQVFCFTIACVDVKFDVSGIAEVKPGLYWDRCHTNSGSADTYLIGAAPTGKLVITLELGVNLGVLRGGVGGTIDAFKAQFPLYGRMYRHSQSGSWSTCGSCEVIASAGSGRLYLYLDWFNVFKFCGWWPCPNWERAVDYTITSWTGPTYSKQLYNSNCASNSPCKWGNPQGHCHRHHSHSPHRHHPHRHHPHRHHRHSWWGR
jgi:hypothetical protein